MGSVVSSSMGQVMEKQQESMKQQQAKMVGGRAGAVFRLASERCLTGASLQLQRQIQMQQGIAAR
jgi:hypothetical protein